MFFNAIARLTSNPPRFARFCAAALLIGLPSGPATAATTVPWHADLPDAQRASHISGRPVLAIFTASWMATSAAVDRTALASGEAVALVTACYEPVCIDVDAFPEITRRVGITRVPMACVLTADGRPLSRFELPDTPAEFVAAAARAAQEAAAAMSTARSAPRGVALDQSAGDRPLGRMHGGSSGFGGGEGYDTRPATSSQVRGVIPPGGRAITAVAAKVRMLSDFASTDCPETETGDAIAASFREASLATQAASAPPAAPEQRAPSVPMPPPTVADTLAKQPSTQSAETTSDVPAGAAPPSPSAAVAPTESLASTQPGAALGIEPPTTPQGVTAAGNAAPWLGLPESAPAIGPAAPQPAATAVAATPPATRVIEPQSPATPVPDESAASRLQAEQPAAPPATAASSLLATLQKPFAMFVRPGATRTADREPEPETKAVPAAAAAATPSEPDLYGPMPVGLEGYCPVMLAERGVWVEGRAQWGARHRGRTYLFAGEQQLKAFLADPDRYAPALSGDDPVLAFDSGKSTPGQRRYGVTYQSRMYLFSSPDTRDAFAANPQRYTSGTIVAENSSSAAGGQGPVVR